MATTEETKAKRKIHAYLKAQPECKAIHLPPGTRGEPDIVGCIDGWMFALEVKAEGSKATKLQLRRLDEWRGAGALVGVVTCVADVKDILAIAPEFTIFP